MPAKILESELARRVLAALREDPVERPETIGGIGHNRGPPLEPVIYTIATFCEAHRISRSTFYNLVRDGIAPRFFKLGPSVRITREAAAKWRAEREAAADQRAVEPGEVA
jgi:predicted DNA-binding transcriptional regulator AlpA